MDKKTYPFTDKELIEVMAQDILAYLVDRGAELEPGKETLAVAITTQAMLTASITKKHLDARTFNLMHKTWLIDLFDTLCTTYSQERVGWFIARIKNEPLTMMLGYN